MTQWDDCSTVRCTDALVALPLSKRTRLAGSRLGKYVMPSWNGRCGALLSGYEDPRKYTDSSPTQVRERHRAFGN
jgi:hypothetical protein